MRIITKIKRKLSFEARTIKFLEEYKHYMDAFSKRLGNQIIQKAEFLRVIIRIKSSLVAFKNNKMAYKKTKNKNYKKLMRVSIRSIIKDKKLIKNIIEQNQNCYQTIFLNNIQKIR